MILEASELAAAARRAGCATVAEGYPERGYARTGRLLDRSLPGAVVHDPLAAAARGVSMARGGVYRTLCIHGDNPQAVAICEALRSGLDAAGIDVAAF